jgi:hypothetical protein
MRLVSRLPSATETACPWSPVGRSYQRDALEGVESLPALGVRIVESLEILLRVLHPELKLKKGHSP